MSAYSDNLNALSNQIVFYYLVTTTPISMTTKLISFYIYTRPNLNNKTNTGFLYLLFSIVNSIGLFAMLFVVRSNILFGYQFKFVCGIDDFIRTNLFNFSSWLQVVISFDRYVLISLPAKAALMLKRKFLCSILIVMALVIMALNSTYFISYPVYSPIVTINNSSTNLTQKTCNFINSIVILNNFIALFMRVYLPFLIMIVLNLLSIRNLKQSRLRSNKFSHQMASGKSQTINSNCKNNKKRVKMSSIEYRFTVSNLALDFIFLGFYLPIVVFYTLVIVDTFANIFQNDISKTAGFNFFSNLAQMCAFTFHLVDIVIFLALNPKIRDEFFLQVIQKIGISRSSSSLEVSKNP